MVFSLSPASSKTNGTCPYSKHTHQHGERDVAIQTDDCGQVSWASWTFAEKEKWCFHYHLHRVRLTEPAPTAEHIHQHGERDVAIQTDDCGQVSWASWTFAEKEKWYLHYHLHRVRLTEPAPTTPTPASIMANGTWPYRRMIAGSFLGPVGPLLRKRNGVFIITCVEQE